MPNLISVIRAVHKNILVCYFLILGGFRDGLKRRVFLSSFFVYQRCYRPSCFNKSTAKNIWFAISSYWEVIEIGGKVRVFFLSFFISMMLMTNLMFTAKYFQMK